jgi:hypothetical protein
VLAGGHDRIYPPEHSELAAPSSRTARSSPKCRSAGNPALAIFPAATG